MPNGQTFTDYFDIEPEISGGMPTDIANGSDMDSAPVGLNCADIMAQYCLFERSNCITDSRNRVMPDSSGITEFIESYPDCISYINDPSPETEIPNTNNMNNEFFKIKSPNFLGGANMRQAIMIFLGLAVLLVVTQGKVVSGTAKAIKKAV